MLNVFSSPGDPIFYLHHTWLDKIWWDWQSQNLSARLVDITGRNTGSPFAGFPGFNGTFPPFNGTFPPFGGPPGDGNCTGFGFPGGPGGFPGFPPGTGELEMTVQSDGDPGNETTLGHVLTVYGIVPNVTIKDVMNIQGETLCYEYV
jgi:tyrosinase